MEDLKQVIGKKVINVIPIFDNMFGDLEKLQFVFEDDTDLIVTYDCSRPETYLEYIISE
ncbi:hypothetical protein [Bacillus infantis]|uniref:hypothetical protein n=1 Tax=Bacillus infantis TaxID=324767 RepID=UPI00209F6DBF|nr:hypothetical protein [Bacillus infantis]MCP1159384.1 hypothetical protein [Bacillus infantis]